jgi:Tol biopolymer transport system component
MLLHALLVLAAVVVPPAANSDASVAPDGKTIAYLVTRGEVSNIAVMRPDGSHQTLLTKSTDRKGQPRWLRDGRLAFSTGDAAPYIVTTMNRRGAHATTVAQVPGRAARLSPDGTHVLYATGPWTSVSLFVAQLDGSDAVRVNDGASVAWNPEWSPDGTQIAYTGRTNGVLDIWLVNADGTNRRQLTHVVTDEGEAQVPAWSPDGSRLAFQVSRKGEGHLWLVDVATGAAHEIAPHERKYNDELPSWFPDGRRLAFQSDRTGSMQIWTMNADGSAQRQLTR